MSSEKKNENISPLYVIGGIAVIGIAAVIMYNTSSTCNIEDEDEDEDEHRNRRNRMITTENYCTPGYSSAIPPQQESYVPPPFQHNRENYSGDYPPMKDYAMGTGDIPVYDNKSGNVAPYKNVSPMGFSQMAGGDQSHENYNSGISDYVEEKDYGLGGQNIPI